MKKYVLTATVVLLGVFGVVIYASGEWIYIDRFVNQPENAGEWPDSFYEPTYTIGSGDGAFFPSFDADSNTISPEALEAASSWAAERNSVALIVLHRGQVALERYWDGVDRHVPYSGRGMTKSLIGILYGFAVADGAVVLDEPAATYLPEWRNDERSKITVRHLLENTSGLENPPFTDSIFNKQTRLAWAPDIAAAALSFQAERPAGEIFNVSSANSTLLAVILQRSTKMPILQYFEEQLWTPLEAEKGIFYAERSGGRAHIDCCFRATPGDWVRLGSMLAHDGVYNEQQVLPSGWVAEMTAPGRHYEAYGLHMWRGQPYAEIREVYEGTGIGHYQSEPFLVDDVLFLEGGSNRVMWVSPSLDLVILRLGRTTDKWDHSFIPNTIIRGLNLSQGSG
ncbi:MAG: serine hydrolase [Rhodospirillaceae bacterium]|nr:serine hydrolase [Rhodospirillaceae bacterium]